MAGNLFPHSEEISQNEIIMLIINEKLEITFINRRFEAYLFGSERKGGKKNRRNLAKFVPSADRKKIKGYMLPGKSTRPNSRPGPDPGPNPDPDPSPNPGPCPGPCLDLGSTPEPDPGLEFNLQNQGGETRRVLLNRVIAPGTGTVLGVIADITGYLQSQAQLQNRLRFESLITCTATEFTAITADRIDSAINRALQRLGSFLAVDRSYVFFLSDDGKEAYYAHEWCAAGVEPQIQTFPRFSADQLPWFGEKMQSLEVFHCDDTAGLPPEAAAEIELFHALGISSILCVPLVVNDSLAGFLGFDSTNGRAWSADCIGLLKVFGEILTHALERTQAETELSQSKALLEGILDAIPDAIGIQDPKHRLIRLNKAGSRLLGVPPDQVKGKKCYEIIGRTERCQPCATEKAWKTKELERVEKFVPELGLYLDCRSNPVLDEHGRIVMIVEQFYDVTERRQMENRLLQLSVRDSLTGLYNRAYFEEEMLRLDGDRYTPVGVIICDVDGLKLVNDTLGHQAGDALLVAVAKLLHWCFRKGDVLARIGGDEFAVLLPSTPRAAVEGACKKIRQAIQEYNSTNPELPLSLSIGLAASYTEKAVTADLFREADNNMYREKLHQSRSARSAIVQTLMRALEARDFVTEGHCDRLQQLVTMLANSVGALEATVTDLRLLAQFHDIGKVGIPDRILHKKGPLNEQELAEMRRHCEIGHRIAVASPDLAPIADWILKHHEWWDGQGYPLGLKGEEIPLACRMLAIVDAYDSMTSERVYRKAMSKNKAKEELMRCAGTQFDPFLVKKFLSLLRKIPSNGRCPNGPDSGSRGS